jgi:DNA ligase D-like protein (predicted ligase)
MPGGPTDPTLGSFVAEDDQHHNQGLRGKIVMAGTKTPIPSRIKPQLVSMATKPPAGGAWRYEIKQDGFRFLVRIDGPAVQLFTKNGHDWTNKLPRLARSLARLAVHSAWLDGEIVFQQEDGRPVFHALRPAFDSGQTDPLVYIAFDLLYLNGYDLRSEPVELRRHALCALLEYCPLDQVRFSETLDADPVQLLHSACRMELEGLVGKRDGSNYTGDRDGSWIKLKCRQRQEFVIAGYTRTTSGIGSLLLGLHDHAGRLVYAGRVRSGLDKFSLHTLRTALPALARLRPALVDPPELGQSVVWVEPRQVCEVEFAELSPAGKLRHPVFKGLRDDKPAADISLESDTDLL